jgi:chromosome segregation ATPase
MAASRSDPEVEQRLRDAEHQSRRLRVTVEMLEHDHRAVLTQMEQARQQLESVQSDRAMLVTRARNQETMITKLEREKRELRRRQRWTDQQTTSLQHEQGALLAELARREYELKQAESGSEQLQDLLRQAREEIKRLADDRDTADARAGERARELSEARAALLETEQEAQHLADELEQLQETAGSAADEAPQDQQPRVPGPEEPAPESAETSNLEVTLVQAAEEREESEEDTREVAALDGDPAQTVDLGPVGSREETREMAPVLLDDEQVAHLEALVAELGRVQTARDSDEADGLAVAANTLTEAGAKIRELLPLEELLYVALVDEDKLTVTALPLDGYGEPLILGTLSQGPGPTREVVDRLLQR